MTIEPVVSALLADLDSHLSDVRNSTTRLSVLVDAGRQLACDLQAIDLFVGLPLTYDLDGAAHALANLDVPEPDIHLPVVTGEQAREALRAVLHVLAKEALAEDLPDDVRAVAARVGADAADACLHLLGP